MDFYKAPSVPTYQVQHPLLQQKGVQLHIKREDQLHPEVSGNKWRKLKYNILQAKAEGVRAVLTFGGAYSNHIAATAAAAKLHQLNSIGIIRGEEHQPLNTTLHLATENGMELIYVSREAYRTKEAVLTSLGYAGGEVYVIPEGGSNALAVKGCAEILSEEEIAAYEYFAVACGTGGTLAGILAALNHRKQALGFPALKGGSFLKNEVDELTKQHSGKLYHNFQLVPDYHFGGYAKWKPELIEFINRFRQEQGIPLDPVYTGKMLFGLFDMIEKNRFKPGTQILAIHTGGLQGIAGFNQRFGNLLVG